MILTILPFLVLGYLLGSIPFAVIVAKHYGIDIFKVGSGNPGATNVKRTCGKKAGNLVFFLDALKGILSTLTPYLVLSAMSVVKGGESEWYQTIVISQLAGMLGAVIGHCFSIFLKFKGGKGVSVTMGALLGVMPILILIALLVWVVIYFATKIVAVASIAFGISLPIIAFVFYKYFPQLHYSEIHIGFCLFIVFFIIVMHRSNIARLIKGKENSFKKK